MRLSVSGVTTSVEMYFNLEELAQAVLQTGARAVLTGGIIEAPGFTWRKLLDQMNAMIDTHGLRFSPGDRIELGYGPHSAYTLSPEVLVEVASAARARDALTDSPGPCPRHGCGRVAGGATVGSGMCCPFGRGRPWTSVVPGRR